MPTLLPVPPPARALERQAKVAAHGITLRVYLRRVKSRYFRRLGVLHSSSALCVMGAYVRYLVFVKKVAFGIGLHLPQIVSLAQANWLRIIFRFQLLVGITTSTPSGAQLTSPRVAAQTVKVRPRRRFTVIPPRRLFTRLLIRICHAHTPIYQTMTKSTSGGAQLLSPSLTALHQQVRHRRRQPVLVIAIGV